MTSIDIWRSVPIYHDIDDWPVMVGTFVSYQEQYPNSDKVYEITKYTDEEGGILTLQEITDMSGEYTTWTVNPDIPPVSETNFLKLVAI